MMNRLASSFRTLKLAAGCTAFAVACSQPTAFAAEPQQKNHDLNVVIVLTDDQGWMDLGCYGSTYYETPHVDSLATQGMRFTQAYSAGAVCSPTRAALLTGKSPARLHATSIYPGSRVHKTDRKLLPPIIEDISKDEITIGEAFQNNGYKTAIYGKWHIHGIQPSDKGFDDYNVSEIGNLSHLGGHASRPAIGDDTHYIQAITTRTLDFIQASRDEDKPFFVIMSHHAPHTPLGTSREMLDKYKDKGAGANGQHNPIYAGMIEQLDDSVGAVVAKLEELQVDDNTAIVYVSDNGGVARYPYHEDILPGHCTSNAPLCGAKAMIYEGGHRVPMIIRWPGNIAGGAECDVPVITMDLYPTLLEMAGLDTLTEQHKDGRSLAPLLKGAGSLNRDALLFHNPHYVGGFGPKSAFIKGDYKYIKYWETELSPHGGRKNELFNLEKDLGETDNLADAMPGKVKHMDRLLKERLREVNAQMPVVNPGYQQ
jgi:arylsulfatase A-like enzyme